MSKPIHVLHVSLPYTQENLSIIKLAKSNARKTAEKLLQESPLSFLPFNFRIVEERTYTEIADEVIHSYYLQIQEDDNE